MWRFLTCTFKDFGNFFKQIAVEIVVTIIVGINLSTSYSSFISFLCDFIQLFHHQYVLSSYYLSPRTIASHFGV